MNDSNQVINKLNELYDVVSVDVPLIYYNQFLESVLDDLLHGCNVNLGLDVDMIRNNKQVMALFDENVHNLCNSILSETIYTNLNKVANIFKNEILYQQNIDSINKLAQTAVCENEIDASTINIASDKKSMAIDLLRQAGLI